MVSAVGPGGLAVTQGRQPKPVKLTVELTEQQMREFTRCAETCGMEVERWVAECAAAKAADAIDAMQADARYMRRQRAKQRSSPHTESDTMIAARAYNAKFKKREDTT